VQTQGSLQESSLASLLQTMQSERATGALSLETPSDSASLYFLFGHLFHAQGPGGQGEEVVITALAWQDGRFRFDPRAKLPPEETIKASPSELIAEAERRTPAGVPQDQQPWDGQAAYAEGEPAQFYPETYGAGQDLAYPQQEWEVPEPEPEPEPEAPPYTGWGLAATEPAGSASAAYETAPPAPSPAPIERYPAPEPVRSTPAAAGRAQPAATYPQAVPAYQPAPAYPQPGPAHPRQAAAPAPAPEPEPPEAAPAPAEEPAQGAVGVAPMDIVYPLPSGRLQYEGLKSAFVDFPKLLRTLRADQQTGYVRLTGPDFAGILLFRQGLLLDALSSESGARNGEGAFHATRRSMESGTSTLDVVDLPADTVNALARLLAAPLLYNGLLGGFVNFEGLLAHLAEENVDGAVIVVGASDVGIILLNQGKPLGAYTHSNPSLSSTTQAVAKIAGEKAARLEVKSGSGAAAPLDVERLLSRSF